MSLSLVKCVLARFREHLWYTFAMDILIRDYQPEDELRLLELIEVFDQYFIDIDPWKAIKYSEKAAAYYLHQMITYPQNGKFLVAEIDNKIVGFIAGHIHKQTEKEIMERGQSISGDIEDFFVLESFRFRGVGTALIEKMEQFFKDAGCSHITLDVFAPNTLAREFYDKNGFTERALILVKRLNK